MLRVENIPFQHALLPYWKEEIFGDRTASWNPVCCMWRLLYLVEDVIESATSARDRDQCTRCGMSVVRRSLMFCVQPIMLDDLCGYAQSLQCQKLSRMCCSARDFQGCAAETLKDVQSSHRDFHI
jgi:hypothetical protein